MPSIDTTPIRSEIVHDILAKMPHWMIRWGNTIIAILILLFLSFAWIIKYPDVIAATGLLTTQVPPQKEYASSSGKLKHLLVVDHEAVREGQDLAVIENTSNYYDVVYLKSLIDTLKYTKDDFYFPLEEVPLLFLGEIEAAYATFENNYLQYENNRRYQPFRSQRKSHNITSKELEIRLLALQNQQALQQQELEFQKLDLDRSKTLYDQDVISKKELEEKQRLYIQAERNLQAMTNSISQAKQSMVSSKNDFYVEEGDNKAKEVRLFRRTIQSFNQLKKAIYDWEMRYILRSEINGTVSFLDFWSLNQQVNNGDLLFTIIPEENEDYLLKLKVSSYNAGKLKPGQLVYLKLDNYPEAEFGKIKGLIASVSLIPDVDGNYLIDAGLPDGLITTYNKQIGFQSEMSGSAEVVTEDLRLLERFFYQFRGLLDH